MSEGVFGWTTTADGVVVVVVGDVVDLLLRTIWAEALFTGSRVLQRLSTWRSKRQASWDLIADTETRFHTHSDFAIVLHRRRQCDVPPE